MQGNEPSRRKVVNLPEITRIEGHAAVMVDIHDNGQCDVELQVFEGTRFFEKIVTSHHYSELPHITSRVCAICSTGHVLASCFAVENALQQAPLDEETMLLRELMHLGMIIESHATHVFALALPDYLGVRDLVGFATKHPNHFASWTRLRDIGSKVQTVLGGRPFHPVTLQVGGFSHKPSKAQLLELDEQLGTGEQTALDLCELLNNINPSYQRKTTPRYLALIPDGEAYGYFGKTVRCSDGWEAPIANYKEYLSERVVPYSHAKRAGANGSPIMVGSMARLVLYNDRLKPRARGIFKSSKLASGDHNSAWNNLGQAIEIVEALERSRWIIAQLTNDNYAPKQHPIPRIEPGKTVSGTGAIECPRGTLYHSYVIDEHGTVTAADMITPSVQNVARIELDIKEVVEVSTISKDAQLQEQLETLVRAYDPCNTCATHMVQVRYRS